MNGWWCVVETRQNAGPPDTLHGPWFTQEDAQDVAEQLIEETQRIGRRDRFQVCALEPEESSDER